MPGLENRSNRKKGDAVNPLQDAPRARERAAGVTAAGTAALSALGSERLSADEPPKELKEILEKLPADDYRTAGQLCERLLAGGPAAMEKLVAMVGDEFGNPEGVKPKYALHGLAHYASRPGAEQHRKLLAETLAKELSADHSDELKAFLVRQLQLCGRPEEVPALAKLLDSDRLCNPATQALAAIGGDRALRALREALPKAEGSRKTAISQAAEVLSGK